MKITAIMALMLVGGIFIGVLAFSALNYILESLAFYTLAKRRGIKAPALAWVPFAKMWTVGKIAEHADNARGIKRKWAITLLVLYVIPIAMILVVYGAIIVLAAMASVEEFLGIDYIFGGMTEAGVLGAIVLAYIIIIVAAIASAAGQAVLYICLYKIFESCDPQKSLRNLLLFLIVPFAAPFVIFSCRNNDKGLPEESIPAPMQYPYYVPSEVSDTMHKEYTEQ